MFFVGARVAIQDSFFAKGIKFVKGVGRSLAGYRCSLGNQNGTGNSLQVGVQPFAPNCFLTGKNGRVEQWRPFYFRDSLARLAAAR